MSNNKSTREYLLRCIPDNSFCDIKILCAKSRRTMKSWILEAIAEKLEREGACGESGSGEEG